MEVTSGVKRGSLSPLPSSTTKRAKLGVPQDELTSLNVELNENLGLSPPRLQVSEEMNTLLSTVLMLVIEALAETSTKANFISPLSLSEAKILLADFNPFERREWEDGIRTCMQRRDWTDLIAHPILQKPAATPNVPREKAVRPERGEEGQGVWKSYAETNETEGQRYCLNIRGHRAVNYLVLKGLEK